MNDAPAASLPWRLFALEPERLTPLERTLLCTLLVIGGVVLVCTFSDIRTYFGDDLRNRVVGARVMLQGHDPYTFTWQPGMPEELYDPVYDPKVHRLTVSPPTLLLYAVIAPFPYPTQRFLSFAAEWLAMIVSLCLLARSLPEMRQRVVFLLGATLFFIATDVWRMHLERGQMYVFPLLTLSIAILYSRCGEEDSIMSGIAFGALALMRPNLMLLAPALLIIQHWRSLGAMLTTVSIGMTLTLLMLPLSSWKSYLDVGDHYYRVAEDRDALPDLPRGPIPETIEGARFGVSLTHVQSSSFVALYQTIRTKVALPSINLAFTSKFFMASLAALLLALLWWRGRNHSRAAFALMIVLALNTEFFLPMRWGYADVMLLAPLALMLPELLISEELNMLALMVVVLGLVSGPMGQLFFSLEVATLLRSWLVMGGMTMLALATWFRRPSSPLAA